MHHFLKLLDFDTEPVDSPSDSIPMGAHPQMAAAAGSIRVAGYSAEHQSQGTAAQQTVDQKAQRDCRDVRKEERAGQATGLSMTAYIALTPATQDLIVLEKKHPEIQRHLEAGPTDSSWL